MTIPWGQYPYRHRNAVFSLRMHSIEPDIGRSPFEKDTFKQAPPMKADMEVEMWIAINSMSQEKHSCSGGMLDWKLPDTRVY